MSNSPGEPADIEPGDAAENPTHPREDGDERRGGAVTSEDVDTDGPLDADEGDPDDESYPG